MPEFLILKSADDARQILEDFPPVDAEPVPLAQADGRVLAEDARSPEDLPAWPRAVMDGYAVRARDTFGASDAVPAFLTVRGTVPMGDVWPGTLAAGEAVAIATGGVLPAGADAVVMVEYTQTGSGAELEVHRGVAGGEHVVRPGDDFRRGDSILPAGHRLRPQDIGALAAVGVPSVTAHRRPVVAILSTGNEIVPPETTPAAGQVRDVNQLALAAQCRRAGAEVLLGGIAPDDAGELRRRAADLLARADALILSGGSSVGARDLTAGVFAELGAEILFHGISVRPGKPTIAARAGRKPVLGMPGVPVSALVIFDVFVRPLIWRLGGETSREPWPARRQVRVARRIPSVAGREDYVRIRLQPVNRPPGWLAHPLLGGSAALSTLVRAGGLLVIPAGSEGIAEDEEAEALLLD